MEHFRDKLKIIFKLHYQSSNDRELIVFLYTKCLFINLFTSVKDESNTLILTFWHQIWTFKNISDFFSFLINWINGTYLVFYHKRGVQ